VKTYALQVEVPEDWHGDLNTLGTLFLAYIPGDQVDNLASIMRVPNSPFYKQPGIPGELANLIIPSYSLLSVSPAGTTTETTGASNSSGSNSNKTRTDAVIGVCVAVGGIAALVGIWWLVRHLQRQQAANHRRLSNLSDPNISNGVYGTQHDDRRTSFFYAEDELRGGYVEDTGIYTQPEAPPVESSVMQQRRPTMQHAPISAPVLQQSSLNW
jgi:hypothetical protein